MVGQLADETDGVGQDSRHTVAEHDPAGARVEGGEQPVLDQDLLRVRLRNSDDLPALV